MRPRRLELEGFTAFRDPAVVDFAGADLFALTGPTGSGKSSIIDAIVFALYGCVPRYDDRRLVAPAITQGRNEARVRLDFTVGDDTYTAVRVVRRTKTGASTKEARLERADGEVLAGNEKEVAAGVESLLGLSFEHFTTCVVLPQGEFARFLHDKPERRQGLLVSLLDLGVYDRMARLARGREAIARARADLASARQADLAFADDESRAAAAARVDALDDLLLAVEADAARLAAFDTEHAAARTAAAEAAARAEALAVVEVPDDVRGLAEELASAEAAAVSAIGEEASAETATVAAEQRLGALPQRPSLETLALAFEQRDALLSNRDKGRGVLAERIDEERRATASLAASDAAAAEAQAALERLQWEHRAHDLAAGLRPGEPCPVCDQLVSSVGARPPPAALDAAREARRRADAAVTRVRGELDAVGRERARIEEKLASIDAQLDRLDPLLAESGLRDAAAVAAALAEVEAAARALDEARAAERRIRARRVQASDALASARTNQERARRAFDAVRDAVARWGAPSREGDDLVQEWQRLAAWAQREVPAATAEAEAATARAAAVDSDRADVAAAIRQRCGEAHIDPSSAPTARDAVVDARSQARATLALIDAALGEAVERAAEHAAATEAADVAGALARHLSATGFEKWVLDEALHLLVAGATQILLQLSGGQYSLTLDERTSNFMVVDHRNADERRSARTLSGGETFLASLALALALADQLALLAAKGGARLESIFLDEGFGTLDPDTLDTVAGAIEELGASGRMVGLVSHVADLAERVPVRFEVVRSGLTATVRRAEAGRP